MKLTINQGKYMLITDGLIMKKKKIVSMSGRKDSGARLFEKPKEKGSALEESGVEAGRNQEETGVASKIQA
jgi:hypothetical protein